VKLDKNLSLKNKSKFELPRNYEYEKAILSWASIPPTKEEFDKKYITSYNVNDFEFLDDKNILVIGSSYGKPWILNWNTETGLNWNWDRKDDRYFKFDNKYSQHNYSLCSINIVGDKFLISGISSEQDDHEKLFLICVNLFVREIKL
jgi:hypothetical protein